MSIAFAGQRLAVVRCCDWFALLDWTERGAATKRYYLARVEADGIVDVIRLIEAEHLDKERAWIAEHNAELDKPSPAPSPPVPAPISREQTSALRKPPSLFQRRA